MHQDQGGGSKGWVAAAYNICPPMVNLAPSMRVCPVGTGGGNIGLGGWKCPSWETPSSYKSRRIRCNRIWGENMKIGQNLWWIGKPIWGN